MTHSPLQFTQDFEKNGGGIMEPVRETRRDETGIWPQILIMEDEPTVAQGLQMILKEVGYEVDLAKTGKEAAWACAAASWAR